jgi:hypothetical protein
MPTPTYIALATTTLGSAASSVTFSSIPGTYRDLVIVFDGSITSGATTDYRVTLNAVSSGYSQVFAYGNGSATASSSDASLSYAPLGRASTNRGVQIWNFMDYSATDKHKTILDRGNSAGSDLLMRAVRWASTNAINSITIQLPGTTITATSSISLYGVAA